MIYVGIDVAKDKHDCFITNSYGEVLFKSFTIPNNRDGFETLFQKVQSVSDDLTKVKVGLEATGHYSYNLLGFLLDKGLTTFVINPLHTNLYRKSLSLRQTKTDKADARTIASMLMSDMNLKSYSDTSYHNEELKSLTRYRFDKVQERAKLKTSISRLVCILFPELEKLVPTLHMASVYALLSEFPSAHAIASVPSVVLTQLTRYLPMPGCLHPLTNQGNWIIVIPIWKNVVPAIFDTLFIMQRNMSAIGMNPLEHILQRSEQRASIIMLPYPMQQKN